MGPDEAKTTVFTVTVPQPEVITTEVKITPQSLNLKSNGRWVMAHIELPEGYSAADIDVSTILLDGVVEPETSKVPGKGKLLVKFSRNAVKIHTQGNYGSTG